jgi:hypothetical protein
MYILTKTLDYGWQKQTRPLFREGARTIQDRNCQTVNYYLVMSPRRASTPRHTDWWTVSRKLTRHDDASWRRLTAFRRYFQVELSTSGSVLHVRPLQIQGNEPSVIFVSICLCCMWYVYGVCGNAETCDELNPFNCLFCCNTANIDKHHVYFPFYMAYVFGVFGENNVSNLIVNRGPWICFVYSLWSLGRLYDAKKVN